MTDVLGDDTEFTELVDADVPRVDLVGRPANGSPGFLLMKQDAQAGLVDPALIRDLIGKSERPKPSEEQVTMTGSPAAIAKLIHQAAQRADTEHVEKETTMAGDDLDTSTVLAEPDTDAPGNPTMPGSPAWEAIDAATACKWTALLARARSAVSLLADREMLEAASGDSDDADSAWDLQDACCAIDYAISVLAPFAVAEQAEADKGEEFSAFGKALEGFDTAALDTIESLGVVRKAGRVLSAANEQQIRSAAESLQKVLASLPQAPTADDGGADNSGLPVAKTANEETTMATPTLTENVTAESGQEPAMGTQEPDPKPVAGQAVTVVGKADGEGKTPMVAVYDAKGNLVGIVDPQEITPISGADSSDDDKQDGADGDGEGVAEPRAADQTTDLQPAPPAEAGQPADAVEDGVAKTEQPTNQTAGNDVGTDKTDTTSDMFKSSIRDVVKGVFDEYSANQEKVVTKQSDAILELAETVKTLKGQVTALEEQPAEPKVFTNGAVPPANMLRGQNAGAPPVDLAKAAELKKQLYRGETSGDRDQAFNDLQEMAVARLQEIHQQRSQ